MQFFFKPTARHAHFAFSHEHVETAAVGLPVHLEACAGDMHVEVPGYDVPAAGEAMHDGHAGMALMQAKLCASTEPARLYFCLRAAREYEPRAVFELNRALAGLPNHELPFPFGRLAVVEPLAEGQLGRDGKSRCERGRCG